MESVFVVEENFRYMNNQCEIGGKIHLVTKNFGKAKDKYEEIKKEKWEEFRRGSYKEKETIEENFLNYEIEDNDDLVIITVSQYKVED